MNYEDEDTKSPPVPLLLIISHARTNPLRKPAPDLKYDIRAVHNPPKQIRDKYTGVDKRLREHMLSHGDFVALLDRAEADIKALIRKITEGSVSEGIPPLKEWKPPRPARPWMKAPAGGDERDGAGEGGSEGEGSDDSGEDDGWGEELEAEGKERPMIKVGVFCVRGRHRSVAFAEELSGRGWPRGWEVRVVHRDLGRSRKESLGGGRKFNRRDSLGRGFLDDDDE